MRYLLHPHIVLFQPWHRLHFPGARDQHHVVLYRQIKQLTPNFSKLMPIWLHISLSQETAPLLCVAESVNTRLCVKLLGSRSSKLSKLPLTPFHRESISLAPCHAAEETAYSSLIYIIAQQTPSGPASTTSSARAPVVSQPVAMKRGGGYSRCVSMEWPLRKVYPELGSQEE